MITISRYYIFVRDFGCKKLLRLFVEKDNIEKVHRYKIIGRKLNIQASTNCLEFFNIAKMVNICSKNKFFKNKHLIY